MKPVVKSIPYTKPEMLFSELSKDNGAVFFDSAKPGEIARYSYIAVDPFLTLVCKNGENFLNEQALRANPFDALDELMLRFSFEAHPELPPFQGGAAGFLGYEALHNLEEIPRQVNDDLEFPDVAIGFYDIVIAFDHELEQAMIFSTGFPVKDYDKRMERADARIALFEERLQSLPRLQLMPDVTVESIVSNFTQDDYFAATTKFIGYIVAGDIFEANLSQRFQATLHSINLYALYLMLRVKNPAPFACFMRFGETVIASASPERFLSLHNGRIETRPIKGTAARSNDEAKDEAVALALSQSEKDRAENIMIVDLMRNDLSRVCKKHSVVVEKLCGLESYETVHHLVSVVSGQLEDEATAVDLLKATFPGGSITGAPKIRAMEIINECEPHPRGPYCGSAVYLGFDGCMDSSILIRTYAVQGDELTFHGGGAITSDSIPQSEYEETLAKVRVLRACLSEQEASCATAQPA